MKRRLWFGVTISVVLMVVILYRVDLTGLVDSFQNAKYSFLIMAVLALLLTQLIRAWRWRYLMNSIKSISIINLLSATSIGAMTDMILPARGGDVVRAYMIGQKEEVSKMASLATIVVERVLDIFTILLIAVPMVAFVRFPGETSAPATVLRIGVYVMTLAWVIATGISIVLISQRDHMKRFAMVLLEVLPDRWRKRIREKLNNFALGLQTIRKGRHLLSAVLLSILLWSTFALSNYFILRSFSFHLPFYAPLLFLVFQVLGVTLPSSPGFIGTYHAAVVAGFAIFDVPEEAALSVAITMHAAFFFPFIALGVLFLWRENLSFRKLQSVDMTRV